jgi:hypothetical protein
VLLFLTLYSVRASSRLCSLGSPSRCLNALRSRPSCLVNPSQGTFPNLFALCRNDLSLSAEKLALKVEQIAHLPRVNKLVCKVEGIRERLLG